MRDPASLHHVAREFRRRLLMMRWGMVIVLGVFAIAAISMVLLPSPWPTLLGFFAMLLTLPLAVLVIRYRCPACGAAPVDDEGEQTLEAPDYCRGCGVALR